MSLGILFNGTVTPGRLRRKSTTVSKIATWNAMDSKDDHPPEKEKSNVRGKSKPQRIKRATEATPAPDRLIASRIKNTQYTISATMITANATKKNVRLSENAAIINKQR